METGSGDRLFYPLFKMMLGVTCLILAFEYGYSFHVYQAASFGILYIGDTLTWFLAGFILFSEGFLGYINILRRPQKEVIREELMM